jgi:hypothetical protein
MAKHPLPEDGNHQPVALPDLRPHQCRWPVTVDATQIGGHLFCARPADGVSPYCSRHHDMATPPVTRGAMRR